MIMYPKACHSKVTETFPVDEYLIAIPAGTRRSDGDSAHSESADLVLLVLSATPICVPVRSSRKIKSGFPSPFTSERAKVNRGYLRASLGLRNSLGGAKVPSPRPARNRTAAADWSVS